MTRFYRCALLILVSSIVSLHAATDLAPKFQDLRADVEALFHQDPGTFRGAFSG